MGRARALSRRLGLAGLMAAALLPSAVRGGPEPPAQADGAAACSLLALPVEQRVPAPQAYREFCARQPAHCRLDGPSMLTWSAGLQATLAQVNRAVNEQVSFMPDLEWVGEEDRWSFPVSGAGDCEDFALEKRRRLAALGLPSAALTLAIVHHQRQRFVHTVLLAETSAGTWVLDNQSAEPTCWHDTPFNFELRERPDGNWTRFDQRHWGLPATPKVSGAPGAAPRPC